MAQFQKAFLCVLCLKEMRNLSKPLQVTLLTFSSGKREMPVRCIYKSPSFVLFMVRPEICLYSRYWFTFGALLKCRYHRGHRDGCALILDRPGSLRPLLFNIETNDRLFCCESSNLILKSPFGKFARHRTFVLQYGGKFYSISLM